MKKRRGKMEIVRVVGGGGRVGGGRRKESENVKKFLYAYKAAVKA